VQQKCLASRSRPAFHLIGGTCVGAKGLVMPPPSCVECGAEFFPEDTGWTACADCLTGQLEWLLAVDGRERKPSKRAADRRDDLRDVTIEVQLVDREAA